MIEEFAIDPAALADWQTFKHFTDKFGVEQGRLLSEFPPKQWGRLVLSNYTGPRDHERAKVEALMQLPEFRQKIVRFGRKWNPDEPNWIRNVRETHGSVEHGPFCAIISSEKHDDLPDSYTCDELRDDDTPLKVELGQVVPQTPESLAEAVAPLLRVAKEIRIIDPHFEPSASRWRICLGKILERARVPNREKPRVELHTRAGSRSEPMSAERIEVFRRECMEYLPAELPDWVRLRVFLWREKNNAHEFHDRFILTDRGGIDSGRGWAVRDMSSQAAQMYLKILPRNIWKNVSEHFAPDSTSFDSAMEPLLIVGTKA